MCCPFKLIIVLIMPCAFLTGQTKSRADQFNFRFDNLTVENGLPSPAVVEIARDSRGFVWFYSSRDIVRYDGFEFRRYPFHGTSLEVNRFGADNKGNLYATDGLELLYYEPVSDQFKRVSLPTPLGIPEAISFLHDLEPTDLVWFRHGDRLYKIKDRDSRPVLVSNQVKSSDRYVGMISRAGETWLSNVKNLEQTTSLQKIDRLGNDIDLDIIPAFVHTMYEDETGVFWMGSWTKGLWRYDPVSSDADNFMSPSLENNFYGVRQLPEWTGLDILWANSKSYGLYLFDRKLNRFVGVISTNETQKQRFLSNSIYSFYYDYEHVLWVGSQEGVSMMHPRKQRIRQIHLHNPKDAYLTLPIVSSTPRPPEELFMLFREEDIRIYNPLKRDWWTINKAAYGLSEQKAGHYFRACYDVNDQLWLTTPRVIPP